MFAICRQLKITASDGKRYNTDCHNEKGLRQLLFVSPLKSNKRATIIWLDVLLKRRSSTYDHGMNFAIGSSECHLVINQIQKRNELILELYIDNSKELFHQLYEHKREIEADLGFELDWRELPEKKASRILITKKVNFNNRNKWQEQFDWLIEKTLKMRAAFKKYP